MLFRLKEKFPTTSKTINHNTFQNCLVIIEINNLYSDQSQHNGHLLQAL